MGDFLGHPLDAWGHGSPLNGCGGAKWASKWTDQCHDYQWPPVNSGALRNPGPRGSVGAEMWGSVGLSNTGILLNLLISFYYILTNLSS